MEVGVGVGAGLRVQRRLAVTRCDTCETWDMCMACAWYVHGMCGWLRRARCKMPCTCYAHAMHTLCTRYAHAMHMLCRARCETSATSTLSTRGQLGDRGEQVVVEPQRVADEAERRPRESELLDLQLLDLLGRD